MANWQKIADTVTRKYYGTKERFDAYKWLSETEEALRPLFSGSDDKHIYFVPLDDGSIIEADFHGDYTILNEYNKEGVKSEVLSQKASQRGEVSDIRNYSTKLKTEKRGFGYPFPEALMNMLKGLRDNEMIIFDNGFCLLCTEKSANKVSLRKVCPSLSQEGAALQILDAEKVIELDAGSAKDIQSLYRQIFDLLSDSVKGRVTSFSLAMEEVSALRKGADGADKRLDFGPVVLHLKKPLMGAAKWTDDKNVQLLDEQVAMLYGWMASSPVLINFLHADEDDMECKYDDSCFLENIEMFFKEGKFDNVYRSIVKYVEVMRGSLKIEIRTYTKSGSDFAADGFVFSYENEKVMTRRATFDENNIEKHIISLKKCQSTLFEQLCREKFNSDYFLMKNNKRSVLRRSLPKSEYIV